jgi:hypothetical protein
MHSTWGKAVKNLRTHTGISSVRLSTDTAKQFVNFATVRVQLPVLHKVFPILPQYISPAKVALSPLIEHYFYPVSTAPINTATKGKLKKGI